MRLGRAHLMVVVLVVGLVSATRTAAFGPFPGSASAVSRCGAGDSDGRILVWHTLSGAAVASVMTEFIADYEASHLATIELRLFTSEEEMVTELMRSREKLPDLVLASERVARRLSDLALFVRPDQCDPSAGSDLLPLIRSTFSINEELTSIPIGVSTQVLMFDAAEFRLAGLDPSAPPRNVPELMAASARIRQSGASSHGLVMADWCADLALAQFTARRLELQALPANGHRGALPTFDLTSPESIADLEQLRAGIEAGHVLFIAENMSGIDDLLHIVPPQDDATMAIHTSGALGDVIEQLEAGSYPGVELGVGPLPAAGTGALVGGNSIWILDGEERNVSRAWEFVKWLGQAEQRGKLSARTGYVPATEAAVRVPLLQKAWKEHPQLKVAYDQVVASPVDDATSGLVLGPVFERDSVLFAGCSRMMRGESAVDKELRVMSELLNRLVAQYEGVSFVPQSTAPALSLDLTVECLSGAEVVGVWVDGVDSSSSWAERSGPPASPRVRFILDHGGAYKLSVGCGGTPQSWRVSLSSGYETDPRARFVCDDTASNRPACVSAAGGGPIPPAEG